MKIQSKFLLTLTILAIAVIGAFAWQVLPTHWPKPETADSPTPYVLSVLPTDQVRGVRGAGRTIIEFGDMECPYCGQIDPQVTELIKTLPDVRLVWKDCPLPSHPNAQKAAEAALCAGDQGKYWEYHDLLIKNNDRLSPDLYTSLASQLKLDAGRFTSCLNGNAKQTQVLNSLDECASSGVEELPWFSVNNKTFSGSGVIANITNTLNEK